MAAVKVGFVLLSNSRQPIPSTRIASLNMFPFLRASNFDPAIVFEPEQGTAWPDVSGLAERMVAQRFDIVVFQKVQGASVQAEIRALRAVGIRTVYCVCDIVDEGMAADCDATVVVTDFLKSLYPLSLQHKVHVVHDGIERPELVKDTSKPPRADGMLNAVLVTSAHLDHLPIIGTPPPWLNVTIVGRYLGDHAWLQRARQARWIAAGKSGLSAKLSYLNFLATQRIKCRAWHPATVYQQMLAADVAIIPIDVSGHPSPGQLVPDWQIKSENRLSMKMALGLPVVATPIPSYEPLVVQGENSFLVNTRAEWINVLDALRDPAVRSRMGEKARATVIDRYSMERQAELLIGTLRSVL